MSIFNQALGISANRVKQFIVQPSEKEEYDKVYVVFSRMSPQEYGLIRKKFNDIPGLESISERASDEEIDPYSW